MDQNPIKLVKLKYRSLLLSQIVAQENCPVQDLLKQHTIRDAILMMKIAYDDLAERILQKSWSKLLDWDKDEYDEEDLIPLSEFQNTDTLLLSNRYFCRIAKTNNVDRLFQTKC